MELTLRENSQTYLPGVSLESNTWGEFIFVGVENGAEVAFADVFHGGHSIEEIAETCGFEIHNLAVTDRGHGYGVKLVEMLQARYCTLSAHNVLPEATGFWQRMGFVDADCDCNGDTMWEWSR